MRRRTAKNQKRRSIFRTLGVDRLEPRIVLHGSVSGVVYVDTDNDGVRDSAEAGVPGVVVRLTGTAAGQAVEESMLTSANGSFAFAELEAGTYQISEVQPAAMLDGSDSTGASGAVTANDQFTNIALAEDQSISENNFGERTLRPEFINVTWFLASSTPTTQLREMIAIGEELAGNSELAATIRAGGNEVPDDDDDGFGTFAPVTTGPFDAANLLGIRTDLQAGAPPITQPHVITALTYAGFSNPPTYGPHHGAVQNQQGSSVTPRPTGVYSTPQPDEDLVHNLEHGHVWISYNPTLLSAADRALLEQFITAGGTNNGVILTPRPKNTSAIAVASWAHLLTLNSFDAAQIRAFIETNRGHAPEGFIPSGQKPVNGETLDDGLPHTPP